MGGFHSQQISHVWDPHLCEIVLWDCECCILSRLYFIAECRSINLLGSNYCISSWNIEAAKKVAAAKKQSSGATQESSLANGANQGTHVGEENQMMPHKSSDEKEKKIRELTAELESTNQRCEVYRANLLAVLRDMEEQKLKLSVKVQNARLSLKE
ncbi:hypothetical protein Vadar_010775 [Vaccinium darrowii]|uniref:Uncharacterized protein n=1 Tax=Vaccinium darrowii TaxID=229202 RepID=A0ACB7XPP4_9ERIC|nr:hypothetical protein Vadar_010775 [Vaccinium darrowii]